MKALYMWLLVGWKILTGKILAEKLEALLENDVLAPKVTALERDEVITVYPDWVGRSRLTSNFETGKSTGVANPRLILHPKQTAGKSINGHGIYAWLNETNQLSECVELADLQWWEQHPNEIPEEFKGGRIYAWASVVLDDYGRRFVPYLRCRVDGLVVGWCGLGSDWGSDRSACLRAS